MSCRKYEAGRHTKWQDLVLDGQSSSVKLPKRGTVSGYRIKAATLNAENELHGVERWSAGR